MNESKRVPNQGIKVEKGFWAEFSQPGELNFHVNDNWRDSKDFFVESAMLFKYFGFETTDFACKRVVDLGAGSRLRSTYFFGAELIVIEPLASDYLRDVKYCDLGMAKRVYPLPAEQFVDELKGTVDFLLSINVLDHCYEFESCISNISRYLKIGGVALLSYDFHEVADSMHPLTLDYENSLRVFDSYGLGISRYLKGLPRDPPTYGHGPFAHTFVLTHR